MPQSARPGIAATSVHRIAWTALACGLGALAVLAGPAFAVDDESTALQDMKRYKEVAEHGAWKIYFKRNSLDIWRGNEPYKGMKNGHASFVVTWRSPISPSARSDSESARSASISYIFSCSPPLASVFAKVVFYATPFVPKEDSLAEQWGSYRQVVATNTAEEKPDAQSWSRIFHRDDLQYWSAAWARIYKQVCSQ
jgi:hypothetical protein